MPLISISSPFDDKRFVHIVTWISSLILTLTIRLSVCSQKFSGIANFFLKWYDSHRCRIGFQRIGRETDIASFRRRTPNHTPLFCSFATWFPFIW
jgi:hypothetical protein